MEESSYESVQQTRITENEYELAQYIKEEIKPHPCVVSDSKLSHHSAWSMPVIIQTALLCIILLLLSAIIIMTGLIWAVLDTNVACIEYNANSSQFILQANSQQQFPNFTKWANDIVTGVIQELKNFSSFSDDLTLKNNSLITQLSNLMQETAYKVNVIGNFSKEEKMFYENNTILLNRVIETVGNSVLKDNNIIGALSNIQDSSNSTAGVVDDILLVVQELLALHNVSSALPTSCKEIKQKQPNSISGVYLLAATGSNSYQYTYCHMEQLCDSGGGWTRIAFLDMSDPTQNCPPGFRLYQSGGVRACGRPLTSSGSCVSVQFPSNGITYSQICGKTTGYQFGTTDAIDHNHGSNHSNLSSFYVDGVSITHGSPRQHVWTLMASYSETGTSLPHCPCSNGSIVQVQAFIGSHYYCESGIARWPSLTDPLWDGHGCDSDESPCCNATGIPWFHRDYGNTTTTDYIELRVCGDEGTDNEDAPVSYYEIYVQ